MDPGVFCDDAVATCEDAAATRGVPLARSPDSVRGLATTSEGLRPRLGGLRETCSEHAAAPQGWVGDFDEFTRLLDDWNRVLSEAARQGWVVGLSE